MPPWARMLAGPLPLTAARMVELDGMHRTCDRFARKMMRQAHAVTDGEVKALLDLTGEERLVALVALLAHASFQDRLLLALGLGPDPKETVPPLTVPFARPKPPPARPRGATRTCGSWSATSGATRPGT